MKELIQKTDRNLWVRGFVLAGAVLAWLDPIFFTALCKGSLL